MSTIDEIVSVPAASYLAGEWGGNGGALNVIDPATEQSVGTVASVDKHDVDTAVAAAVLAQAEWMRAGSWARSAVLRRIAEQLRADVERATAILTAEQGKPLREAQWEVHASADQFDWYADEARRVYGRTIDGQNPLDRVIVRHEPVGITAAFSSWNFPSLLAARKIAPALAAGCPVLASPSPEAPLSTLIIAEAAERAGLPAGMLSVLVGDPVTISTRLLESDAVRKVSLTGSVPVGRLLLRAAAEGVKNVSMELGGHAPVLVFADADVNRAAEASVAGKFRNGGQVCASPSRFIVHASVAERFTAAMSKLTARLSVGNGRDPSTEVGPLANDKRINAAEDFIADAVAKGATVAAGGGRDERFARGYFFRPTVLTGVSPQSAIMTEEPFVPVAPIMTFETMDEAMALANSTPFALASYLFSFDMRIVTEASERLEAGMVGVNTIALAAAEAPFGGNKLSGFGREGGIEGIADYLTTKYVRFAF